MEQKQLEKLLEQMTLEEKVGQMIQVTGKMLAQEGNVITGPTAIQTTKRCFITGKSVEIRRGLSIVDYLQCGMDFLPFTFQKIRCINGV